MLELHSLSVTIGWLQHRSSVKINKSILRESIGYMEITIEYCIIFKCNCYIINSK